MNRRYHPMYMCSERGNIYNALGARIMRKGHVGGGQAKLVFAKSDTRSSSKGHHHRRFRVHTTPQAPVAFDAGVKEYKEERAGFNRTYSSELRR